MKAIQSPSPSPEGIAYYYKGFRRLLRRYRTMTLLGWVIVFAGFGSLFLGWRLGLPHGLIDLLLSAATICAGLLVVQQAVVSLEEYIAVPFGVNRDSHPAFDEIGTLMSEMARGGWREARKGAAELERIASRYGLITDHASSTTTEQG